jgi:hypothetical protein
MLFPFDVWVISFVPYVALCAHEPSFLERRPQLVDTLMKNCGQPVYQEVSAKDFQKELQSVLNKERKKGMVTEVHDRILSLVQMWADAFQPFRTQFPGFTETYNKLTQEGYHFPPRDPSDSFVVSASTPASTRANVAPTSAPAARTGSSTSTSSSTPGLANAPASRTSQQAAHGTGTGRSPAQGQPLTGQQAAQLAAYGQHIGYDMYGRPVVMAPPPQGHQQPQYSQQQPSRTQLSLPEQREKLKNDLAVVSVNAGLLIDMLQAAEPGEDFTRNELVQELLTTVRAMQPRLVSLLESVSDDVMMMEVLSRNDEVNRALDKYEQLSGARVSRDVGDLGGSAPQQQQRVPPSPDQQRPQGTGTLLDMNSPTRASGTATTSNPNAALSPSELLMSDMSLNDRRPAQHEPTMMSHAQQQQDDDDMFNLLAQRQPGKGPAASAGRTATSAASANDEDDFDKIARRTSVRSSNSPVTANGAPAQRNPAMPVVADDQDEFDSFLNARLAKHQGDSSQSNMRTVDDKQKQRMENKNDELFEL